MGAATQEMPLTDLLADFRRQLYGANRNADGKEQNADDQGTASFRETPLPHLMILSQNDSVVSLHPENGGDRIIR